MNVKLVCKVAIIVLLCAIFLITFPFLFSFLRPDFSILKDDTNEFFSTLLRTVLYATIGSFLLVAIGFFGALPLKDLRFLSKPGRSLGFLILPITIGNLSVAFIAKLLVGDTLFFARFANSSFEFKSLFVYILQVWQYGLLFIYLYWLSFKEIPENILGYAKAQNFSRYQIIKDVLLPRTKNLTILLLLLGFLLTVFDDSKLYYLFKISQGTHSELITTWMTRNYQSSLLVSTGFAENLVLKSGNFVFVVLLAAILASYLIIRLFYSTLSRLKIYFRNRIEKPIHSGYAVIVVVLLVIAVCLPLLLVFTKLSFSSGTSFAELRFSLLMVFIASVFSSFTAIGFAITARLAWPVTLKAFDSRSLIFFIALFLLMLVPPIIILVCGFKWMAIIGYRNEFTIYCCWILGHTILSLPMLSSFIVFNHFRLTNNELDYIGVYKLNFLETIKYSFIKRFKAEYLLLFIISYATIWNEGVMNNLFSDYIPSFASQLKMMLLGSGADYSQALGYLMISAVISFISVAIWQLILNQAKKNESLYENN